MHYISNDFWATTILVVICYLIVGFGIEAVFYIFFHRSFFLYGSAKGRSIKGVLLLFLAGMLATGIDEAYSDFINPHHLHITDKIEYYDPYIGHHYIPLDDDSYCTSEGDRITKEEGLRIFHETHDVELDAEGNVIRTYPKGKGPKTDRSMDSPYYTFNMSEEQLDAYESARGIVENVKIISKAKLYERLTDQDDRYKCSTEAASFALEALEKNGLVDWAEFCKEEAEDTYCFMSYLSRDDMLKYLTEDKGYTVEEARLAVDEIYDEG